MDADEKQTRASSFGAVASDYATWRPGYPDEAVSWLVGAAPVRVYELASGTGKFTTSLCAIGHRVIASDVAPELLDELAAAAPRAARVLASAEDIPLADQSVDVVISAQAYHWFDLDRAEPEMARVLKPGGALATVWNRPDSTVPWVRKLFSLSSSHTPGSDDDGDPWIESEYFTMTGFRQFRHWQQLRRDGIIGLLRSQSMVATATDERRAEILDHADRLYDDYARGPAGLTIPWVANCYRGRVKPAMVNTEDQLSETPIASQASASDDGYQISFS